jgi:hypothetical protein
VQGAARGGHGGVPERLLHEMDGRTPVEAVAGMGVAGMGVAGMGVAGMGVAGMGVAGMGVALPVRRTLKAGLQTAERGCVALSAHSITAFPGSIDKATYSHPTSKG